MHCAANMRDLTECWSMHSVSPSLIKWSMDPPQFVIIDGKILFKIWGGGGGRLIWARGINSFASTFFYFVYNACSVIKCSI